MNFDPVISKLMSWGCRAAAWGSSSGGGLYRPLRTRRMRRVCERRTSSLAAEWTFFFPLKIHISTLKKGAVFKGKFHLPIIFQVILVSFRGSNFWICWVFKRVGPPWGKATCYSQNRGSWKPATATVRLRRRLMKPPGMRIPRHPRMTSALYISRFVTDQTHSFSYVRLLGFVG